MQQVLWIWEIDVDEAIGWRLRDKTLAEALKERALTEAERAGLGGVPFQGATARVKVVAYDKPRDYAFHVEILSKE